MHGTVDTDRTTRAMGKLVKLVKLKYLSRFLIVLTSGIGVTEIGIESESDHL